MKYITKISFVIFTIILLSVIDCKSQNLLFNYFPLDSMYGISGNYADIRSHHFHSGIDFRTCSREGLPVYAVDSGYVARIFISPNGFGKALYIKHSNGYTTVYAHLLTFNDSINSYVRREQYRKESFSMDVILKKGDLKVNACDLIAYSGNSGSSEGPHLHFETRNSKSEITINPTLLGFGQADTIPPHIEFIKVYPGSKNSTINKTNKPQIFKVSMNKKACSLAKSEPIAITGSFSLGVNAYDLINSSVIKYDIRGIKVTIDTTDVFCCMADSFAFSDTRYVDTYIDYPERIENSRDFIRTYRSPNNNLNFYKIIQNDGVFALKTGKHLVKIAAFDINGNSTQLAFAVIIDTCKAFPPAKKNSVRLCIPQKASQIALANIKLDLPKNALFDTATIAITEIKHEPGPVSSLFKIGDNTIPLFKKISLYIKPTTLPEKFRNKVIIVKCDSKGEVSSSGGEWSNGFIKTNIQSFGNYKAVIDTIAPIIKLMTNISCVLHDDDTLKLTIKDKLSGIDTYKPYLNGKWIAMEYDIKSSMLTLPLKEGTLLNDNSFILIVTDKKGNMSRLEFEFIRD